MGYFIVYRYSVGFCKVVFIHVGFFVDGNFGDVFCWVLLNELVV